MAIRLSGVRAGNTFGVGGGDVIVRITVHAAAAQRALTAFQGRVAVMARQTGLLDLHFRRLDRIWTIIAAGSALALGGRFIKMIADMQSLQIQIGTFERSWDKVGLVMDRVVKLTSRVPFTLGSMSRAFVRLKAAGLDPIVDAQGNGPLKDLADAVAAFGGGDEIFQRATIAIQQMAGKGVISMEELRQQLGEAVPLAMRLMAQELDLTVAELIETVSRGNLEFKKGIDAFFEGARKSFGGASDLLVNTISGQALRFQKIWEGLALRVDRSGLGMALTALFSSFNDELDRMLTSMALITPDQFFSFFEKIASDLDRSVGTVLHFLSVIGSIAGVVTQMIGALPPEVITGGIIGFIFAGRAGAGLGALLGTLDTLPPFIQNLSSDMITAIPDELASLGIIGLLFFGKKKVLKAGTAGFAAWIGYDEILASHIAFKDAIFSTMDEDGILSMMWMGKRFLNGGETTLEKIQRKMQENLTKAGFPQISPDDIFKQTSADTFAGLVDTVGEAGKKSADKFNSNFFDNWFLNARGKVPEIVEGLKVLESFAPIDDFEGLDPAGNKRLIAFSKALTRIGVRADAAGSAIKKLEAETRGQLGIADELIGQFNKKLSDPSATAKQVENLERGRNAVQRMRDSYASLSDQVVKQLGGNKLTKLSQQFERMGKSLDVFLAGEGVGAIDAVDLAVARVENRFAGWQLQIDRNRESLKDYAVGSDALAEATDRVEKQQAKWNAGLAAAIPLARATAEATKALTVVRAESALKIAELNVQELLFANTMDKASVAATKAQIQITRMVNTIEAAMASDKLKLNKGNLSPEKFEELKKRYQTLLKLIADETDDFVERARFNASEWGILMNSIAESLERTFSNALEGLINGTASARDVMLTFYNEITRAAIRYLIEQAKVGILSATGNQGGSLSQVISGVLGAVIGSFAGGGVGAGSTISNGAMLSGPVPRAGGGRLGAGQMALVGEQGPELFLPDVPGTIIPGGRAPINITINAVDAGSVRDLFMREGSALVESLQLQARMGNLPNENT